MVLRYVVPMGDDLFYGRWGRLDVLSFLQQIAGHYQHANGRNLVHILDGILLGSDTRLAIARLGIAVLLGSIAVSVFRIAEPTAPHTVAVAVLCACGVFLWDPALTRQSVYWVTGAMNYVFPLALLLLYWQCLRRSLRTNSRWKRTMLCGFAAGATTEQISVMAFGLTLLLLLEHLWLTYSATKSADKSPAAVSPQAAFRQAYQAIPRPLWFTWGLTTLGMLTVILAPGNFYRASITPPAVEGGLFALIRYNIKGLRRAFLFGDTLFAIHFLAMTVVPLYLFIHLARTVYTKKREPMGTAGRIRFLADSLAFLAASAVFCAWLFLPDSVPELLSYSTNVPHPVTMDAVKVLVAYLLTTLYAAIHAAVRDNRTPLFAYILGVGSQVMMLLLPTSGSRTMLCCVGMLLLFIACLMQAAPYLYLLGAGAWLAWHWGQAWVVKVMLIAGGLWLLSQLLTKRSKPLKPSERVKPAELAKPLEPPLQPEPVRPIQQLLQGACALCCCVPLLFCGYVVMERNYTNYRLNAATNAENRATIAAYPGEGSLTLRKFPVELYSWVMPYHNPYYNPYFNLYYGLPQETVIVWEG